MPTTNGFLPPEGWFGEGVVSVRRMGPASPPPVVQGSFRSEACVPYPGGAVTPTCVSSIKSNDSRTSTGSVRSQPTTPVAMYDAWRARTHYARKVRMKRKKKKPAGEGEGEGEGEGAETDSGGLQFDFDADEAWVAPGPAVQAEPEYAESEGCPSPPSDWYAVRMLADHLHALRRGGADPGEILAAHHRYMAAWTRHSMPNAADPETGRGAGPWSDWCI